MDRSSANRGSSRGYAEAPDPATLLLTRLSLASFRAHADTVLVPSPGVNLLVGANGAGKTNVLEAISYLGVGKSFLGASDGHVLQRGQDYFAVQGGIAGSTRADAKLRLAFVPGEGKRAFVNGSPLERLSGLVGRLPVVVFSPADWELTAGGPSERRRLVDSTLSQAYPVYLDDLLKYRRALRQKNALLLGRRRGRSVDAATLDAWDEELAVLGGRVVQRRAVFLERLAGLLVEAHTLLGSPGDPPTLSYVPSLGDDGDEPLDRLRSGLNRTRRRSLDQGRTLVGPHLDEVRFQLAGFDLRPYASQGQHRTFALAVRIAQALYLFELTDERPVLLLDDVFGPLDPERTRVIVGLLVAQTLGQSFITSAQLEPFRDLVPFQDDDHVVFHVEHGTVAPLSLSSLTS